MSAQALHGLRVLEYGRGISGAYCTKLMADLGAEVIHIEPPGAGDDTRRLPPFVGDVPHPEKSGLFLFLNTNKLGITLDPRLSAGADLFRRLAAHADVIVEDWPPQHMEKIGLHYAALRRDNAGLIMASLTPFGRSGPYKDYKAYGLNISHASGQGYMLPLPSPHFERAPAKIGGTCTDYDSGQTMALAILAALYWRALSGRGQFIEISQQEAVLSLQRIENVVFANGGEVLTRKGPKTDNGITQAFQCQDGYVVTCTPLEHQKHGLRRLAGVDADIDPECLHRELATRMQQRTIADACAEGQSLSVPISSISSSHAVMTSPQLAARGFFTQVDHPDAGSVTMPNGPCGFSRTPFELHRAPRLGEHNELVYGQRLGFDERILQRLCETGVI